MVINMTRMKGQSAIEYLTTYGWMLLVIAIVGGAIFTTVQSSSGIQQTTGFTGSDVQISNFGLTSGGNLSMEIRAAATDELTVTNVSLEGPNSTQDEVTASNTWTNNDGVNPVPAGETQEFEFSKVESAETSNQFDVEVTYNTGALSDVVAEGTLTGNIYLNKSN